MYRMVTMVNNTFIYLKVAKIVNLKISHHKKNNSVTIYGDGHWLHFIVAIILQYIQIANHVVHLKLI